MFVTVVKCVCVDMALSQISEPSCKLQTLQKDMRLAINMSDSVDQPLHVGAAVNEVFVFCVFNYRLILCHFWVCGRVFWL